MLCLVAQVIQYSNKTSYSLIKHKQDWLCYIVNNSGKVLINLKMFSCQYLIMDFFRLCMVLTRGRAHTRAGSSQSVSWWWAAGFYRWSSCSSTISSPHLSRAAGNVQDSASHWGNTSLCPLNMKYVRIKLKNCINRFLIR